MLLQAKELLTTNVTEASLEKLQADWVEHVEQLTYYKDSSVEKHFLRPIQVYSMKPPFKPTMSSFTSGIGNSFTVLGWMALFTCIFFTS